MKRAGLVDSTFLCKKYTHRNFTYHNNRTIGKEAENPTWTRTTFNYEGPVTRKLFMEELIFETGSV